MPKKDIMKEPVCGCGHNKEMMDAAIELATSMSVNKTRTVFDHAVNMTALHITANLHYVREAQDAGGDHKKASAETQQFSAGHALHGRGDHQQPPRPANI